MRFRSIRWQITLPFACLILVAMVGLSAFLSNMVERYFIRDLEIHLENEARLLAKNLEDPLLLQSPSETLDQLVKSWSVQLKSRITVVDMEGNVLAESEADRTQMENHLNRPEVQQALRQGKGSAIRYSETLQMKFLYTALLLTAEDGKPLGLLRVAYPLQQVETNLRDIQLVIWFAGIGVILLGFLIAFWVAHRTTQPLKQINLIARQITAGNLNTRVYFDTNNEISQIAESLNEMSNELSRRIEQLQTEQSRLATILAQMTDGVIILNPNGEIDLINPAAETLFNVNADQVVGNTLVRALRYHQLMELWENYRASGKEQASFLELPSEGKFIQVILAPLQGTMTGHALCLFQNLTQIRKLETIRRDFISNISHELRTPLASLKAIAETLQMGALEDPESAVHFLERMDTEIDAMVQMVNELLELSRIESGLVPLQFEPVDPCAVMNQAVERLRAQADRAGLELFVQCAENIPFIQADGRRLEQVLVNLIHNAIKFTSPPGSIECAIRQDDKGVIFSVKDTGIGIAPEDIPRIFERFYKVEHSRRSSGTGLGLSIARHLVEGHGGKIWVESEQGKGSTFFILIPYTKKH